MAHFIDKLEVARRQICEAIYLFFEERDPVSIHTLIASAHQILFDVGKISNVASAIKATTNLQKPEIQELLKAINYPYNFFKHADKDPDAKINIEPLERLASDFIMDSIVMLQRLANDIPNEAKVFWYWFVSKYPQEFDNLPKDGEIAKMQEQELANCDFPTIVQLIKFYNIFKETNKANVADAERQHS